jgi:hypothetical protein
VAPPGIEHKIIEHKLHALTVFDPQEIAKKSPYQPQAWPQAPR